MKTNVLNRIVKYVGIVFLLYFLSNIFIYRERILTYFDLSWLPKKCILCNFENRHDCNLCKFEKKRCPFCDNSCVINDD